MTSSIFGDINLSPTEELFVQLLQKQEEGLVEVEIDKSAVRINGVNRGSFEDTKAVFSDTWSEAQLSVQQKTAKENGVTYNSVVCSATSDDLASVVFTKVLMDAISGQTNVPIKFKNGNTLIIANSADLNNFLAVWVPVYRNNGAGFTYVEEQ